MNRTIKLGGTGVMGRGEFRFEIPQAKVLPWIAELALLLGNWYDVQQTKVLFENGWSVTLAVNPKLEPGRAMVKRLGEHSLRCDLPQDLAEAFQAFLVRTYRDGMAQVNHIHIEGFLEGEQFDFTPLFDVVAPPLSAEEAERLILGSNKRKRK